MTFLTEFDTLDERAGNELLYNWIKYRRDELFEELRVARPALSFWSHRPGNPDIPAEAGPGRATLLTRREDVKHALANYSMKPYVLRNLFLLSEDEPDVHARLREALGDSFRIERYPDELDGAVGGAWRAHVDPCEAAEGRVTLDVRAFARDAALAFARAFFGLPDSPDAPDELETWSALGYERFIWKLHARHFVEEVPDPRNEALVRISQLVATHWENPVPGSMIDRLRASARGEPDLTDERLIANVVGSLQGMVDNVMTGACYALAELVAAERMGTVQLLAREGRLRTIRAMLHEAHRADTPSPFLPRRVVPVEHRPGEAPTADAHVVCAIGSALNDPSANRDTGDEAWDLRLGYGPHACLGKRIGDDLMVRLVAAVAALDDVRTEEPLLKRWGWIVSAFTLSGTLPGTSSPPDRERVSSTPTASAH